MINHCMVKNIYNAKQNRIGIGAILIQQKSSTMTLMISDNSYTNCDEKSSKNLAQDGPTDHKNQTQIKPRNVVE
jgi:hypothetical protein